MDNTDSGSGFQTLASVLAGGLAGYVDAQNNQPVYVQQPAPQTAFGYAGQGQATPSVGGISPTMLLILGAVVVAVFVLKK